MEVVAGMVAPIGRQVGYLIFYKNNFKELTDNVKKLEGVREPIQRWAEAETRSGSEIEFSTKNWLERADDVIRQAILLQEDPLHSKVGCSRWSFPNLMLRHRLSRKAKKMAIDVLHVQRKGRLLQVGYVPAPGKLGLRELIKNDVLELLKNPKVSNIGIYGLAGIGKTVLVKEVARKAMEDKLFDVVGMTTVTQTPDLRRIQGQIADTLGLRFEEESDVGRARRLHARIKREKTILIVLDNIWTRLDLGEVGIPFGDEHNGCKLLLTSRDQDVLHEMETQKDFRLEFISEEETWSLFEVMAGDVVKDLSLRKIATQVATKCAGWPLPIVVVARALRGQDIYAWKDALKHLESAGNREMDEAINSALKLSYNRLEDDTKAFFLLAAVLLGSQTNVEYLLKCAMGLDMFKRINTVEDARNRLDIIISRLKASCLLLEDDTGVQVKMNSLVRDVAVSIARRDQYVFTIRKGVELKEWPMEDFLGSCTQIILDGCYIEELPERLDCSTLKLFYLNSANNLSLQFPNSFFQGMGSLQVLKLKGMDMSSLPTSLLSLINLKTLCLDQCSLEDLAGIGDLMNLEILSLVKSSITKFPIEIGKLINLRITDFEGSRIEAIPPKIISNLIKLEELHMGNTTIKWEIKNSSGQNKSASLSELTQLHNLAALDIQIPEAWMLPVDLMFEKLERYKIVVGDKWDWTDTNYEISKRLMLKLHTTILSEHGIKVLIKRVEDLYLDEVDGISNILHQLDGEGFPLLKYLHIQNNTKIQHIINSMESTHQARGCFPNLEKLELHNLSHLDKIYHGPLNVSCFSNLRFIKVNSCDRLESLFLFSMVKGLSQTLLEIEIAECHSLKEIVGVGDFDKVDTDTTADAVKFQRLRSLTLQMLPVLLDFYVDEPTSSRAQEKPFFGSKVAFPKLETLKLKSLNFKKIWEEDQHFPTSVENLTSLIVEDCGHLNYLCSSSMFKSLSNLTRLEISHCHAMDEIIKTAAEEENYREAASPKLETLKLSSLINLKKICGLDQLLAASLLNLTSFIVENCGALKYLFSSSMIWGLSQLKRLEISKCHMMEEILHAADEEEIFYGVLFPNLETVIISDMENLKTIWQWRELPAPNSFGRLKTMEIKDCRKLLTIFSVPRVWRL